MFIFTIPLISMQTDERLKIKALEDKVIRILAELAHHNLHPCSKFSLVVPKSSQDTLALQTPIMKVRRPKASQSTNSRPGRCPKNVYPEQINFYNAFKPQKK